MRPPLAQPRHARANGDAEGEISDFRIITRSRSSAAPILDRATVASISTELLAAEVPLPKGVRLLGVSLSSLSTDESGATDERQMALKL
jgi:DNA polymerase-4